MNAKSLLDELADLGATGNSKPLSNKLEISNDTSAFRYRFEPVIGSVTEERAEKMVRIADIVVSELGSLIEAAARMREALLEMKTVWSGQEAEERLEEAPDELEVEEDEEDPGESDIDFEEDEDAYDRPMNAVAVFIPEPVPLPPDVADLED